MAALTRLVPQMVGIGQGSGDKRRALSSDPAAELAAPSTATRADVGAAAAGATGAIARAASATVVTWSDTRPFKQQLPSYPATCFLAAIFVLVYIALQRRRVSPSVMGSSYRQLVVRGELWRVITAAVTHGGVLHLAFNITSLWACRRMEAELGSWAYLVASAHLLALSEVIEKALLHLLLMTGRYTDGVSIGYSGVVFAWMVVMSLQPDAPQREVAGVAMGGFTYVLINLLVMKILIRGSSFTGHLAGVWAGLVFSTGALNFARQRFWGMGVAVWGLSALLGSLKATTALPVPLVDYVDTSRGVDVGVRVLPFDWSNRESWEDYVVDNA